MTRPTYIESDDLDLDLLTDPERLRLACRRSCVPKILDLLRAGWRFDLPREGDEPWEWRWVDDKGRRRGPTPYSWAALQDERREKRRKLPAAS